MDFISDIEFERYIVAKSDLAEGRKITKWLFIVWDQISAFICNKFCYKVEDTLI